VVWKREKLCRIRENSESLCRGSNYRGDRLDYAIDNLDRMLGLAGGSPLLFNYSQVQRPLQNPSKHDVFPIQEFIIGRVNEKLTAISVRPGIGHRHSSNFMIKFEILVIKHAAIDRNPACAITPSKISTLDHKARNDPMEFATCVSQLDSGISVPLITGTQGSEILSSLWDIFPEQTNQNWLWLSLSINRDRQLGLLSYLCVFA
jgi:hypothetical protein